jgi:hypothetical protein
MYFHPLRSIATLTWTILMVTLVQYMHNMVFFLFQLGAFRIHNFQRAHVERLCVPVQITLSSLVFVFPCVWENIHHVEWFE